jgi:hypothetical protein
MLKQKGFLSANATGYYGVLTREAVRKYQKSLNLVNATGSVGPKTIEMIKKEVPTTGNTNNIFTEKNISTQTIIKTEDIKPFPPINEKFLTLLSPNGGEYWKKRDTQKITWKDSYLNFTTKVYDVVLSKYYPPCTVHCPLMPVHAPYVIAQKVSGNSFDWVVGDVTTPSADLSISEGLYVVAVCVSGTEVCDASDKPFTIQ